MPKKVTPSIIRGAAICFLDSYTAPPSAPERAFLPHSPPFLISRFINSPAVYPREGAPADAFENLEIRKVWRWQCGDRKAMSEPSGFVSAVFNQLLPGVHTGRRPAPLAGALADAAAVARDVPDRVRPDRPHRVRPRRLERENAASLSRGVAGTETLSQALSTTFTTITASCPS